MYALKTKPGLNHQQLFTDPNTISVLTSQGTFLILKN